MAIMINSIRGIVLNHQFLSTSQLLYARPLVAPHLENSKLYTLNLFIVLLYTLHSTLGALRRFTLEALDLWSLDTSRTLN